MLLVTLVGSVLLILAATQVQAQTFTVLHTFTGERSHSQDGAHPMNGVVLDRAGNLYEVTFSGGLHGDGGEVCFLVNDDGGCGTVFKLTKTWLRLCVFQPLQASGARRMATILTGW